MGPQGVTPSSQSQGHKAIGHDALSLVDVYVLLNLSRIYPSWFNRWTLSWQVPGIPLSLSLSLIISRSWIGIVGCWWCNSIFLVMSASTRCVKILPYKTYNPRYFETSSRLVMSIWFWSWVLSITWKPPHVVTL